MIADHVANIVFVADTLVGRFPSVYGGLKEDRVGDGRVLGLDCRELPREGGAVHCVTWDIRS